MRASRRGFLRCFLAPTCAMGIPDCGKGPRSSPASLDLPESSFEPVYVQSEKSGRLKEVEKQLWEIFRACRCCPRACGVNRLRGEKGFCSSDARLKVYSAGPHFGEESPLVGRGGSGTVFFSHCNLLCCYCQNWQINHRGDGEYVSADDLAELMLSLQRRGCHNINVVTPTHVAPNIVKALRLAIPRGLRVPIVYNTGGYDNLEVVQLLESVVDIYLPDFKYTDGAKAARYSSGAADYPEVAAAVIREMHRQVGELKVERRGIARRGLMIRHLVLPNDLAGTEKFVRWVARELSPDTYVNLMAQYRPEHKAREYPELSRRITVDEWQQALRWAREAGLRRLDGAQHLE
jgi:putative pyruvate formate lyase activating enzyme